MGNPKSLRDRICKIVMSFGDGIRFASHWPSACNDDETLELNLFHVICESRRGAYCSWLYPVRISCQIQVDNLGLFSRDSIPGVKFAHLKRLVCSLNGCRLRRAKTVFDVGHDNSDSSSTEWPYAGQAPYIAVADVDLTVPSKCVPRLPASAIELRRSGRVSVTFSKGRQSLDTGCTALENSSRLLFRRDLRGLFGQFSKWSTQYTLPDSWLGETRDRHSAITS